MESLIGCYNYEQLQKSSSLYLSKKLNDNELNNLRYISDNVILNMSDKINFFDIIDKLDYFGKKNRICISYSDKVEFNKKLEIYTNGYLNCNGDSNNNYSFDRDIFVKSGNDINSIHLKDYCDYENLLYLIVREAYDFSPLEKYLFAYDITKKFKLYKKNKLENKNILDYDFFMQQEIKDSSRNLYDILDNNYIVCAGFVNLLRDLLLKLDIPSINYGLDVDLSAHRAVSQIKNNTSNWKDLDTLWKRDLVIQQQSYIPKDLYEGHKRLIVSIKDDKYGVDGFYFSDPTWDNDLEENTYTHALMTCNDVDDSIFKSKLDFVGSLDLFFATSVSEFNKMLGVLFDRNIDYLYNNALDIIKNSKDIDEEHFNIDVKFQFTYFFNMFVSSLITLFPEEGEKLINKYPFIKSNNWPIESSKDFGNSVKGLIYDCSIILLSKTNKDISRDTLINAVKEIYKNIYTDGLTDEDINKINNIMDKEMIFEFGFNK